MTSVPPLLLARSAARFDGPRWLVGCLCLAACMACGGRDRSPSSPSGTRSERENRADASSPNSLAAGSAGESTSTSRSPTSVGSGEVPVLLELRAQRDGVGFSVVNAGPHTVSLASAVALEDGSGRVLEDRALLLQHGCAPQACVNLAPGGELLAPNFLDLPAGGERCGQLLLPKTAGSYLLRVRSCDGAGSRTLHLTWPLP